MIKKYKFLFLLLLGLFVFLPKDTFAESVSPTSSYTNGADYSVVTSVDSGYYYTYACSPKPVKYLAFQYQKTSLLGNRTYYVKFVYTFYLPEASDYSPDAIGMTAYSNTNVELALKNLKTTVVSNTVTDGRRTKTFQSTMSFTAPQSWGFRIDFSLPYATCLYGYNMEESVVSDTTIPTTDTEKIIENQNENTDKIIENQNENTDKIVESQEEIKDSINDDDVSDAEDSASSFFDDFESDDFGLSDIITMPLSFIRGLSSSTCYSLNLPLPFVDTNVSLPCMTSIYQRYFGSFLTLYQTITTGIIAYWVCINIFRMVQGFKNPDSDEIEVMEL